jgi:hypothetical protein
MDTGLENMTKIFFLSRLFSIRTGMLWKNDNLSVNFSPAKTDRCSSSFYRIKSLM